MALVLSRKSGEKIIINDNITITVHKHGDKVRLEIDAPKDVKILREELKRRAA